MQVQCDSAAPHPAPYIQHPAAPRPPASSYHSGDVEPAHEPVADGSALGTEAQHWEKPECKCWGIKNTSKEDQLQSPMNPSLVISWDSTRKPEQKPVDKTLGGAFEGGATGDEVERIGVAFMGWRSHYVVGCFLVGLWR